MKAECVAVKRIELTLLFIAMNGRRLKTLRRDGGFQR
jgi:hypothetical protein